MKTPEMLVPVFNELRKNKVKAYNYTHTQNLSMCINFLGTENQDTVIMTLTIMKQRKKKNSLDPREFAVALSLLEKWLDEVDAQYSVNKYPFFTPFRNQLPVSWYKYLECHRVFFLPKELLWQTIGHLFTSDNLAQLQDTGLSEISIFVDTSEHEGSLNLY